MSAPGLPSLSPGWGSTASSSSLPPGLQPPPSLLRPAGGSGGSLPTTLLEAGTQPAVRPLAPARPMSSLEFELWIMFFFVLLLASALLSKKKWLPDHMFSAFTNEWWPHVDPTFMPMFIMTLCQHNTAFLNRNILYPFSLLTMMTGGQ